MKMKNNTKSVHLLCSPFARLTRPESTRYDKKRKGAKHKHLRYFPSLDARYLGPPSTERTRDKKKMRKKLDGYVLFVIVEVIRRALWSLSWVGKDVGKHRERWIFLRACPSFAFLPV